MNESITPTTTHFTACATLAAIGAKMKQLDLFGPIKAGVQIKQKTIKYTPIDKLTDAFISPAFWRRGTGRDQYTLANGSWFAASLRARRLR
jgi:hypothetical protein